MTAPQPDARAILEARARRLARRLDLNAAPSGLEMLGFTVGRERFALESRYVFAVFQLSELVPLPGARAPVVGVTRWRGDVLTVLDLRRVVGGVATALDDLGRVIVVGESSPEFGILADALDGLSVIDTSALLPLPVNRVLEIHDLLRGITQGAVHVVDAKTLIHHQTGAAAAPGQTSSTPTPGSP